jgi:hypothetical protein
MLGIHDIKAMQQLFHRPLICQWSKPQASEEGEKWALHNSKTITEKYTSKRRQSGW